MTTAAIIGILAVAALLVSLTAAVWVTAFRIKGRSTSGGSRGNVDQRSCVGNDSLENEIYEEADRLMGDTKPDLYRVSELNKLLLSKECRTCGREFQGVHETVCGKACGGDVGR